MPTEHAPLLVYYANEWLPRKTHLRYFPRTSSHRNECLPKAASRSPNVEIVRRISLWLEMSSTRVRPSALTRAYTCFATGASNSISAICPPTLLEVASLPRPTLPLELPTVSPPTSPLPPTPLVLWFKSQSHSGRGSRSSVPISSSLFRVRCRCVFVSIVCERQRRVASRAAIYCGALVLCPSFRRLRGMAVYPR